jgi:hypothetical protein
MKINSLAPVILFVYNRPEHTLKTLTALMNNILADQSELFIFSDGAKETAIAQEIENIKKTREIIHSREWCKTITIIEGKRNKGLAKSIIDGVTCIINKYDKVIVLEDDIVTSPYFLKFMNTALDFYAENEKVWHICGWDYPIDTDGLKNAFLWYTMNCWGWATWKNRWQYFKKDINAISDFSRKDIYLFNVYGMSANWEQILANVRGRIDTWAVFWYATIFKHKGLCLNSTKSYVKNIGFDGSGIHCSGDDMFNTIISLEENIDFTEIPIEENKVAVERIIRFLKKDILHTRIVQFIYRSGINNLILYKKIKRIISKK